MFIVQVIGGLVLLFLGGEILIRASVTLARAFAISPFVIGLTVVAYGTSSPELFISVQSATQGFSDIALGNVIGSNISNIFAVLGVSALLYPVVIDKKVSFADGFFLLLVTIMFVLICIVRQSFGVAEGLGLMVVLCGYTWFIIQKSRKTKDMVPLEQTQEVEEQIDVKLNTWQAILACIAGVSLLVFGADTLITGATTTARILGVSEAAIGVTIVAFGGSVPELVTSVIAAIHRKSEIVIGNIIGSNLFNILGIIGVTSMVAPVDVSAQFLEFDVFVLIAATVVLSFMLFRCHQINRWVGGVFAASYIAYIWYQFV